ncbi:MAG: hypothetical protein V4592_04330 [Bacteroidota bacterium]
MKKYLTIIILLVCYNSVKGQLSISIPKFSDLEKEQIETQAKDHIADFTYYLSDLASSKTPKKRKSDLKKQLLALFIDTAKIEVKSVAHPDMATPHPINDYLNTVAGYGNKYQYVAIKFERVTLDLDPKHLRPTTINGHQAYIGKFYFLQKFRVAKQGLYNGLLANELRAPIPMPEYKIYGDDTYKNGDIIIVLLDTPPADGPRYQVLLGNITAGEIVAR